MQIVKNRQRVVLLVVLAMLVQLFVPAVSGIVFGEEANAEGVESFQEEFVDEELEFDEEEFVDEKDLIVVEDSNDEELLKNEDSDFEVDFEVTGVNAETQEAEDPKDVTNILIDLELILKQNGKVINEGGTLTPDSLEVNISFGVPVEGDLPTPNQVVNQGDYAIYIIEGFSLVGGPEIKDLVHKGTKLGTLEFSSVDEGKSAQVKVIFDGEDEVFNGGFREVSANFNANLQYVGNEQGTEDESYSVTILGKTFTVNVPAIPKEFSGQKTGVKNGDTIDWKIKVEGTQGGENLSLSGLKLVDDLSNVGSLIGGFKYSATDNIAIATDFPDGLVTKEGSKYTLEFPEGTVSPVYLYFTTQIGEDFVTNGERIITNTARLFDGEDEKLTVTDSVKFENRWIEKEAGLIEYKTENVDGTDKTVAYITWYITVNHMGASLTNARIIDVLDSRLEFVESQWYEKSGENWTTIGSENSVRPVDDKYFYPNPPLNQNVQLRIKTRVKPDQNIGHTQINITNQARLEWDNGPGPGVGSGSINVGIGTNPINKSAGSYDLKNHTIPWTVTVEKSDVFIDLRVMDLLVYGSTFNYGNVSSIVGSGSGIESINFDDIKASLTPSYRQKYKPGSFSSNHGLTLTVYTLIDGNGKAIADLLVASEGGSTIDLSDGNKVFSFETIVTDPAWYLSNTNKTVRNTAMLFSANNKLNQQEASRTISPRSTFKDMLKAEASVNPLVNKNDRTTNSPEGFNYEDKSVVFRLFVNQNGVNATGGITTVDGVTVGDVTVEDILPSGWEFVDIEDDTEFYLFKALGSPNSMTVGDRITDYGDILSSDFNTAGRATFTFTELKEPYVIFVKARPTEDTINGYFNDNKTTTVTNTLNLTSTQHQNPVSNDRQVTIISQVLDKNMTKLEAGVLKWTVSYRPYDIFQNVQVLDQYRLIDTLPQGLELYTDSGGNLDFTDGNFTVTEMTLTPSGYVASGPVFTEQELQDSISYDNVNRKLIFTVPDKEKAYRLEYKTMVTANSGSLTNSVVLEGVSLNTVKTSSSYSVASADASATMTRNGWVEIEKVNQNGSRLPGSRFTVFTSDKSLALRTGVTDAQGKLVLRGLPVGNYILMETEAPAGYDVSNREYSVSVTNDAGTVVTSIDGKIGSDSNKIKVTNILEGTSGNLKVLKVVSGNDGDESKDFEFTLRIGNLSGEKDFEKTDTNGNISFGSVIFNNGSTSFSIKHNESITIVGLPKDVDYTLTEDDYSVEGYETYINDSSEKERVQTGKIAVNTTQEVSFENIKDTFGDLLIEKIVAGNAGDLDKQFTFVFKFENPFTGSYTYEGLGGKSNGMLNLDIEGKATVSLKHGESIKVKDLPKGLSYSIEEEIDAEDIYDVSIGGEDTNKAEGTIQDSSEKTIRFTNSKSTFGNLVVRKNVDGLLGELDRQFNFTLQMGELEVKTYEFEVTDSDNIVISSGNMTFDSSNKVEFSLKDGEAIKIKGLPNRATYSVIEEDLEEYQTMTSGNEERKIVGLSTPVVEFRNTRSTHGTLEVEKEVTGNGGNRRRDFSFSLNVEGISDGVYEAMIMNVTTEDVRDSTLNFVDGNAEFLLKHGERLSVNLPVDIPYTLIEEDYRSIGYTTEIIGEDTGVLEANETVEVLFTNNRQVRGGSKPLEPEPEEPVEPETPVDPQEPTEPTGPTVPTVPTGPTDPTTPSGSGNQIKPENPEETEFGEGTPGGGTNVSKEPGTLPKTGDAATRSIMIMGAVLMIFGFLLGIKQIKRKSSI